MNRIFRKSSVIIPALILLSLLVMVTALAFPGSVKAQAQQKVVITLFWGNGCAHCAAERPFLASLQKKYPNLEVRTYELWYEESNLPIMQKMAAAYGFEASGVPITFIGDKNWIGYSEGLGVEFEEAVKACSINGCKDPVEGVLSAEEIAAGLPLTPDSGRA